MAFATIDNSPRLQAVLRALQKYPKGMTGLDLCYEARVMNPGEVCSELRKQGYTIECNETARTPQGRRIFWYKLVGEPNGKKD